MIFYVIQELSSDSTAIRRSSVDQSISIEQVNYIQYEYIYSFLILRSRDHNVLLLCTEVKAAQGVLRLAEANQERQQRRRTFAGTIPMTRTIRHV